jgi:uncharacterized membrane protein
MNKVIFVGFDTEQKAYEGDRVLHAMHREGTLTLYNDAVVVKEPGGLGAGTLLGAAFDLTKEGVDRDFVEDAGVRLEPGKAAVIAEIDEQWQVPLDTRMEGLGGKLVRRTQTQIEDAYLEREIETAQKDLAVLESETVAEVKATQTEKARNRAEKLQAKIDAAKRRVQEKEDELARKLQSVKVEGDQKIAMLEAQKATATAESTAALERRLADVRSDYERRTGRLQEAVDRRTAANATVVG